MISFGNTSFQKSLSEDFFKESGISFADTDIHFMFAILPDNPEYAEKLKTQGARDTYFTVDMEIYDYTANG